MRQISRDPAVVFVRGFGLSDGIQWGFWLAIVVWWVVELELGPFELVLMGTALEGAVLLAETPTGVVADVYSRKWSMIIAQAVMAVSFVWAVASHDFWVILPAQVMFGVGWTFRSGADTAWVTDELKGQGSFHDDEFDELLLRKHRSGIWWGLVSLAAVAVVGTFLSVRWAVALTGVATLMVAGYFVVAMDETHFTPGRKESRGFRATLRGGLAAVTGQPRLRALVLVIVALDMGAEGFDRLGFKHFLDTAAVDDESLIVMAVLFVALALAGLLLNSLASSALDRRYGVARVAVGLLVVAAVGGAVASATSLVVVIAVGYMLQDSAREALWPVLDGWANRDAPTEVRATVHSLMSQTTAISEVVGGLLLGAIAEFTSIRTTLVIASGLFGVAALLATRGVQPRPLPVD